MKIFYYLSNFVSDFTIPDFTGAEDQFVGMQGKTDAVEVVMEILRIAIAEVLLPLIATASLIIITISGIRYIVSAGSETQTEQSKKTLMDGFLGLVITIFSWTIIAVISDVTNTISGRSIYFSTTTILFYRS